jgi:hypothetical protein
VSECQRCEFAAVDRPFDGRHRDQLRAVDARRDHRDPVCEPSRGALLVRILRGDDQLSW